MFESITFETILQRMLDRVTAANPNIDTREGSLIYTALAPAAVELQNMYIQLDTILNETFADTASREYLIKRAAERGINVKKATKAIRKGEFNIDVPIGSRFSLNLLNYTVIEKISNGVFKLECETAGSVGNGDSGTLLPIQFINGLTSAELTDVLIPGEDEEDTEALRQRYFNSFSSQAFGGNIADYKQKVGSMAGVGGVKVYPAWNGGGTVKLVIIDSTHSVPSSTLIDAVQTAIDPTVNAGQGVGLAPIGHVVTVTGVAATPVDIELNITYQSGWNWVTVQSAVHGAIDAYFKELSATWQDQDSVVVRISQLENRLLDVPGIVDVMETKLNGSATNLVLGADEIPIRGTVVAS